MLQKNDLYKNIWVFVELNGQRPRAVSLELLGQGRKLADSTGQKLAAVVLGNRVTNVAGKMIAYGADLVYLVEGPEVAHYTTDGYTKVFCELIERYKPSVILFGATTDGQSLGPRIACRMETGLSTQCTGIDIDKNSGVVYWTRPIYNGHALAVTVCPEHRPQMGTIRPASFPKPLPDPGRLGEIVRLRNPVKAEEIRTKLFGIAEVCARACDIDDAEVVVAGGLGMGNAENFHLLEELADSMGGMVGATRPVIDADWMPYPYQIGQTGKRIRPAIYFACGISGAVEHLAGISSNTTIIAVNIDPEAPIFKVADYGIVGDVRDVLPLLTLKFKQIKGVMGKRPAASERVM